MAKPLLYPEWATTNTTLPATGNTNKQRPKESLRSIGWDKGQVPTAEEWNWQFDNISDWIVWFNENNLATKTFTLTGDVAGTVDYTNEGGFSVTTVIQPNSVTLGLDTTGNYVATANVSGNGLSGSSSTEGGTFTVSSNAVSASTPNTLMYRDGNGDVAANRFVGSLTGNADSATNAINAGHSVTSGTASLVNSITNNISILTGIIAHGGTIPLPSGYSEGQCRWTVSTADIKDFGGDDVFLTHHCFTTGRVVSCYTDGTYSATGNANYIIIGFK